MALLKGADADELVDRRQNPDRRGSVRRKLLRGGRTFWPNGDSSECMVRNLSETGAQLIIQGPVPNLFDLVIEGDQSRHACAVAWRQADRVGVKFTNRPPTVVALKPVSVSVQCRRYADECRRLAKRATLSDRKLLLEMADTWIAVTRRLTRNSY
jgi:PilZ domain